MKTTSVLNFGFSAICISALQACGGGGGTTPAAPSGTATATVTSPLIGKAPWNLATPVTISLKDGAGAVVTGTLSCAPVNSAALAIAADCTSLTGKRVGSQGIQVSGGGVSATVNIKVIPQAQPFGMNGSGSASSSVVTQAGNVLAWGDNAAATLGQGQLAATLGNLKLPAAVKDQAGTGLLQGIVATSTGTDVSLALTEDGEVWSWGGLARAARGGVNKDPLPGKVRNAGNNASLSSIVSISAGDNNVTALVDDGTVFAWGNYTGVLPDTGKNYPVQVPNVGGAAGVLSGIVGISSGRTWSAALTGDGRVVSWGNSSSTANTGQSIAANSLAAPGYVLRESDGAAITDIVAISAGYNFGMALTSAGQVYAWGGNANGQLGQNTASNLNSKAVLVKSSATGTLLSNIKMISAGGIHALALDTSGGVYSWGYSQSGQLGDGANHPRVNQSSLPAAVVNESGIGQLSNIVSIATTYESSVALTASGQLVMWGSGLSGRLGQGGTNVANLFVPTLVKNEAGTGTLQLGPISTWPNLLGRGR
jgi:alpha-tubulin suppressor-like RCC1 family protein